MPTIEKTSGGRVYVRSVWRRFAVGDSADVSEAQAAYLCDERGDFERVDDALTDGEVSDPDPDLDHDDVVEVLEESEMIPDDSDDSEDADGSADTSADSDDSDIKDHNAVADGPYRDRSAVKAGECGYFDPDEMDSPCARDAGWGRDEDGGLCQTHAGALED